MSFFSPPSPPSGSGQDAFVDSANKSFNSFIILGIVVSIVGLIITIVCVFCFFKWLKRHPGGRLNFELFPPGTAASTSQAYNGGPPDVESNSGGANEQALSFTGLTVRYAYNELYTATNGFSRRLGSGAFGAVYEGILKDGNKVAVKLLNGSGNERDFRAEVETLGTVHHRNVVRLRGFCAEGQHRLLVYDFMPGGSLDSWLFAPRQQHQQHGNSHSHAQRGQQEAAGGAGNGTVSSSYRMRPLLPWEARMHIALGSAKGLAYLHDECAKRIIHLDIKPHNILLDSEFNPKVADFGLAKLMDWGKSMVETVMQGTPGYLAPEWLVDGAASPKMDVYSLGIVFLELVSGRRVMESAESVHLREWTMQLVELGKDLEVADPRLKGEFDSEQVKRMIQVALCCVQREPNSRPGMKEVVQMIEQPHGPIPPAPLDTASMGLPWRGSEDSGSRTSLLNSSIHLNSSRL